MRRLVAAVTVAALGWLAGTSPAPGARSAESPPPAILGAVIVATPRFVPAAGPVLAGDDRLAWVSRRDDSVLDLWVAGPDQGPRRVQRFVGSDTERLRLRRLSASSAAVGLELLEARMGADGRERTIRSRSYLGAFGQPLRRVERCAGAPTCDAAAVWPLVTSDATGARGVSVTRGCESAEIRMIALPAPAAPRRSEPVCPLRLRSTARIRHGRLRLGVSCAGFSIDCAARVRVRAGGRLVARGVARYNHSTPPYAAADLKPTAFGTRLLRAKPHARVQIVARIGERGLLADPSLPGAVTRRTSRTIGAATTRGTRR
jgi:hypothetical protein